METGAGAAAQLKSGRAACASLPAPIQSLSVCASKARNPRSLCRYAELACLSLELITDVLDGRQVQAAQFGVNLFCGSRVKVSLEVGNQLLRRAVMAIAVDLCLGRLLDMLQFLLLSLGPALGFCPHHRIKCLAFHQSQ